jgi:TRAP-type transport system periplasmic protein
VKKNIFLKVMITMVTVVILSACGSKSNETASSSDKVYEINFNISASPTSSFTKDIVEPWVELVKEKSEGKLQVNVFTGAALGSLATGYEDIQDGVYELGMVSPGRHMDTELFPLTIGDLPFALITPQVANTVLSKYIDQHMTKEGSFGKGTYLTIYATDAWNLYSKEPVETIEDIKGKNVSDSVSERLELIKDWGGSPVNLANTELYEGLERGTVDKVVYTSVGAKGFNLHEVAPYLTKLDIGGTTQLLLLNTDFLKSLPEDLQTLLTGELADDFLNLAIESYTSQAEEAINSFEDLVKDSGGKVIIPSEKALKEFKSPTAKLAQDWVERANKKGYNGEELLEDYNTLLEDAGVESPF